MLAVLVVILFVLGIGISIRALAVRKRKAVSYFWGAAVLILISAGGLMSYLRTLSLWPGQETLINNFQAHRAAYERLRNMLQQDEQIGRVGSSGVETTNSAGMSIPPKGDFPLDRYNEYLSLLKAVGGTAASRSRAEHPNLCTYVWGWGWAGYTRHAAICWLAQEPSNQVDDLDGFEKSPRGDGDKRRFIYKHIDENWYIQENW
jgi:hypothetical protein